MHADTPLQWFNPDDMSLDVETGTAAFLLEYDDSGEIADALAVLDNGAECAMVGGGAAPWCRIERVPLAPSMHPETRAALDNLATALARLALVAAKHGDDIADGYPFTADLDTVTQAVIAWRDND